MAFQITAKIAPISAFSLLALAACGGGGGGGDSGDVIDSMSTKFGQVVALGAVPASTNVPQKPLLTVQSTPRVARGSVTTIPVSVDSQAALDALFLKIQGSPRAFQLTPTATTTKIGANKILTNQSVQLALGGDLSGNQVCFTLNVQDQFGLVSDDSPFCIGLDEPGAPNQQPDISPLADQSGAPGAQIALTATATDPDGEPVSFEWLQLDGPGAQTSGADTATLTITLPQTSSQVDLVFQVVATDTRGLFSATSVNVRVENPNRAPIVDAGPSSAGVSGGSASLTGSASDPDGNLSGVQWSQLLGPAASISSPNNATTDLGLPNVEADTTLVFELVATDALGASARDATFVVVSPASGPSPSPAPTGGPSPSPSPMPMDSDGDGVQDAADNCPQNANPGQEDVDGDGAGDACDPTPTGDTDGDGIDNAVDNCPDAINPDQTDTDNDMIGDNCDSTPNGDSDGDGVDENADNCPSVANPDQSDQNGNGVGDACDTEPHGDPDSDGDGVPDNTDNCPSDFNPVQHDDDMDGIGNVCDPTPNGS